MNPLAAGNYQRVVIKIGSALLVDEESGLQRTWLQSLADDLRLLTTLGMQPVLVSSGAIALGRILLASEQPTLSRSRSTPLTLEESQAAAAIGQIELARAYREVLAQRGLATGQILLTLGDTKHRRPYLNARATIETLLSWNAVPVINENDSVATSEICYGDNDRLAARVASMINADLLLLLSDVHGLYRQPPPPVPDDGYIAENLIRHVACVDDNIEAMAGESQSAHGTGGMRTKIAAAKIATAAGTTMVIASGRSYHPIQQLFDDQTPATWFAPSEKPVSDRKKWIAGQLEPAGHVHVDEGAEQALRRGKSLLCSGVTNIEGHFSRGDTVAIYGPSGTIGRGLIGYNSHEATQVQGMNSQQIASVLGLARRTELIHRDDLVIDPA